MLWGFSALLLIAITCYGQEITPVKDYWYMTTSDSSAKLYVVEFGKGDTVVVLHGGWGGEHSYLFDPLQGLDAEYHFVLYDQRGSLRSPCSDSSKISVAKHVEDLEKLRKEFHLQRMTLLAHSMGTFLAMSYLEMYPANVKGLVLLGPIPPKIPNDSADNLESYATKSGHAAEALVLQRSEVADEYRKYGLERRNLSEKEESYRWRIKFASANIFHVDRWRQMREGGRGVFYSGKAAEATISSMPEHWDFTNALMAHPYPITVIVGDHDYADLNSGLNRRIMAALPNVEVLTIKDAGHCAWIDDPQLFRGFLDKALRKYR